MRETASFGQWLSQRRKALHLTQEDLAERMACSSSLVRKIEAGQRVASQQMADLLAETLGVVAGERPAFVQFARGLLSSDAAKRELWQTLHTAAAHPTNLAAPLTALIGREQELERLHKLILLDNERLITLTGPPGIGKTRLSLEVGIELLDHFEDGVFFVSLAPVSDPELVPAAIAQVLGVNETGSTSITENLALFLREKRLLLLLDNFEQVLDASPHVLGLLGACSDLKVLATSREALHVYGEQQYPVPALATADPENLPPVQTMWSIPAVALFIERAQAIKPDFVLTEENANAVAAICTRLEGLPLAIELAAARVRLLSPLEILTRLDSRLRLLTSGLRDLPSRQQTLHNAIDWSYNLLSETEQRIFTRLGVFSGGATLSAIEAICNVEKDLGIDVLDGLDSLVSKSLLKQEETEEGESRFTMLEMLRDYSLGLLQASGRLPTLMAHHAQYYLSFAEDAGAQLDGEQQLLWLRRLDEAYENIRAAIARSIDNQVDAATVLQFAGALHSYWIRRGYVSDTRNFLSTALARTNEARSPEKATALYVAGRLAIMQGDYLAGRSLLSQSLDLYRELRDRTGMSLALTHLGTEYDRAGDFEQARQALEEALAIAREIGKPKGISEALGHFGAFIQELGNHRGALPLFEESLSLARQSQDKGLIGAVLLSLGDIARLDGDYARARATYEESVALFEANGTKMGSAFAFANLAQVALKEGDPTTAAPLLAESLALFQQMGHRRGLLQCIAAFAALHLLKGDIPRAISLLSATQAAMNRNEANLEKIDHLEFEEHVAEAQALAGAAVWSSAWAEGQAMTLKQAVKLALGET